MWLAAPWSISFNHHLWAEKSQIPISTYIQNSATPVFCWAFNDGHWVAATSHPDPLFIFLPRSSHGLPLFKRCLDCWWKKVLTPIQHKALLVSIQQSTSCYSLQHGITETKIQMLWGTYLTTCFFWQQQPFKTIWDLQLAASLLPWKENQLSKLVFTAGGRVRV